MLPRTCPWRPDQDSDRSLKFSDWFCLSAFKLSTFAGNCLEFRFQRWLKDALVQHFLEGNAGLYFWNPGTDFDSPQAAPQHVLIAIHLHNLSQHGFQSQARLKEASWNRGAELWACQKTRCCEGLKRGMNTDGIVFTHQQRTEEISPPAWQHLLWFSRWGFFPELGQGYQGTEAVCLPPALPPWPRANDTASLCHRHPVCNVIFSTGPNQVCCSLKLSQARPTCQLNEKGRAGSPLIYYFGHQMKRYRQCNDSLDLFCENLLESWSLQGIQIGVVTRRDAKPKMADEVCKLNLVSCIVQKEIQAFKGCFA